MLNYSTYRNLPKRNKNMSTNRLVHDDPILTAPDVYQIVNG